ncbi:MAG: metallophosphoesterase [Candidatus Nanoarchaeia archaeon]
MKNKVGIDKVEICPGIEICDLAIWIPNEKALILADLHLGRDFSLASQGYIIPQTQLTDTLNRIKAIINAINCKPNLIIINGDFRHDFGMIPFKLKQDLEKFVSNLSCFCKKIILIKGNHDTYIPIKNEKLQIVKNLNLSNIFLCHGDSLKNSLKLQKSEFSKIRAKTIIIGHVHPMLKITDGFVSEKVKCFVKTKWKRKVLIIQPSFDPLTDQISNVFVDSIDSQLDQKELEWKKGEVWAVPEQGKILYFGIQRNNLELKI